jgi:hypothetical protein
MTSYGGPGSSQLRGKYDCVSIIATYSQSNQILVDVSCRRFCFALTLRSFTFRSDQRSAWPCGL